MRITALALDANRGWPGLRSETLAPGLNVFHGPAGSGKTTLVDLIAHALFGRRLCDARGAAPTRSAEGELLVESGGRDFRLRRYFDATGQDRLTVAAIDGSDVDRSTVRQFLGGLSPAMAAPVFVPSAFGESVDALLSVEFLRKMLEAGDSHKEVSTLSRKAGLVAQRDALARELEMHIAGERLESRTLDERWRQLDRLVQEAEGKVVERRERLRAVIAALAEVDTRLRYLEIEATVGQQSRDHESGDWELQLFELDEQIAQWRTMLAKLQQREAAVRGELTQIRPDDEAASVTLADQRTWLTVARRCTADLQGEVARLARATDSQTCVCHDAHPRLQPIVETIVGQLGALEALVDQQQRAAQADELGEEADDLARSQAELQRQVEHLLQRRQAIVRGTKPNRRPIASITESGQHDDRWRDMHQLDQRRWQLQKEHAELLDELAKLEPRLRDLRTERDAVDRQRAGMLSAPSIDALRGQLAAVQRQLECATHAPTADAGNAPDHLLAEAGDFLAQLTDGGLVGIQLERPEFAPSIVNRDGRRVTLASLTVAQRHQVRLSLSLALASICQRRGGRLPLVLDEPFAGLDAADATALAAVLDDVGRRGQQVLVFTGHQAALERLTSLGVTTYLMRQLQLAASTDDVLIDRPSFGPAIKGREQPNGHSALRPIAASGAAAANGRRRKPKRKGAGQ